MPRTAATSVMFIINGNSSSEWYCFRFIWLPFSHAGNRNWFLNGRKELPNQSFLFYFLHAATVGGRGVCAAQTWHGRGQPAKPHTAARRAPRRGIYGCADVLFLTCAAVQPLVLRPQAALWSGFSLQAAFWYQNAMLALFLRRKKSLKRSSLIVPFRRFF